MFLTVDNLFLFILQYTEMHEVKIIYYIKFLSFFNTFHKHIDAFVLSCSEFNDSSAKEFRVLHWQLVHEQQFPLPRHCGVCEGRTNASLCSGTISI